LCKLNDINVIIPTLNEEDGIGPTIDDILNYVEKDDIIVLMGIALIIQEMK